MWLTLTSLTGRTSFVRITLGLLRWSKGHARRVHEMSMPEKARMWDWFRLNERVCLRGYRPRGEQYSSPKEGFSMWCYLTFNFLPKTLCLVDHISLCAWIWAFISFSCYHLSDFEPFWGKQERKGWGDLELIILQQLSSSVLVVSLFVRQV